MGSRYPQRRRFPGNEDRRSFRIKRSLSKPSRRGIDFCSELGERFPASGIEPKQGGADLTIIGKMDISDIRKRVPRLGRLLFPDLAREILEPPPATAERSLQVDVTHVDFIGQRRKWAALFLADPGDLLANEYAAYTERLDRMGAAWPWKGFLPHISLALVPKESATSGVLTWIEERAPKQIMLLPVSTDPRTPNTG